MRFVAQPADKADCGGVDKGLKSNMFNHFCRAAGKAPLPFALRIQSNRDWSLALKRFGILRTPDD